MCLLVLSETYTPQSITCVVNYAPIGFTPNTFSECKCPPPLKCQSFMLAHSGFYIHILRALFINQIYVVSRYMHFATCHNEQFFYYVMMGLTCHKPHKRHGSLLNRMPLMYVCLFKKIRRKCISLTSG